MHIPHFFQMTSKFKTSVGPHDADFSHGTIFHTQCIGCRCGNLL